MKLSKILNFHQFLINKLANPKAFIKKILQIITILVLPALKTGTNPRDIIAGALNLLTPQESEQNPTSTPPVNSNSNASLLYNAINQANRIGVATSAAITASAAENGTSPANASSSLIAKAAAGVVTQGVLAHFGLQDAAQLLSYKPLLEFLQNLPTTFANSLMSNAYSGRSLEISSNSENVTYTLSYDMQDQGSGNPSSPFGFIMYNQKYYFHPAVAVFSSTDNTSNISQILDLTNPTLAQTIIKLLSIIPQVDAQSIYQTIARTLYFYPENLFMFKALLLLTTAYKNSNAAANNPDQATSDSPKNSSQANTGGYPRFVHIPIELAVLFQRLSITPNYQATVNNHDPKQPNSSLWDPTKISYFDQGPQAILQSMPAVAQNFINSITLYVPGSEYQQMQDRNGKPISNMQRQYSALRSVNGYEQRCNFWLNNILPLSFPTLGSLSDQILYVESLMRQINERYSGFSAFLNEYIASLSPTISLVNTSTNISTQSINNQNIDITLLRNALKNRLELINHMITQSLPILQNASSSKNVNVSNLVQSAITTLQTLNNNITQEAQGILAQINEIASVMVTSLDNTQTFNNRQAALQQGLTLTQTLRDSVQAIEGKGYQPFTINLPDQSLNFSDYMGLRYFQFLSMNDTRFRGDIDFLYNDSFLDINGAINQAMSVILRAYADLSSAEILFSQDSRTLTMLDSNKTPIKLVPKDYYAQKIATNTQVLINSEKTVEAARQAVTLQAANSTTTLANSNTSTGAPKAIDASAAINHYQSAVMAAQQAANLVDTAQLGLTQYLVQYTFDRRNLNPITAMGSSAKPAETTSITTTSTTMDPQQQATQELISQFKIYGPQTIFNIGKMYTSKLIDAITNLYTNSNTPAGSFVNARKQDLTKEQQISNAANAVINDMQSQLNALAATLTTSATTKTSDQTNATQSTSSTNPTATTNDQSNVSDNNATNASSSTNQTSPNDSSLSTEDSLSTESDEAITNENNEALTNTITAPIVQAATTTANNASAPILTAMQNSQITQLQNNLAIAKNALEKSSANITLINKQIAGYALGLDSLKNLKASLTNFNPPTLSDTQASDMLNTILQGGSDLSLAMKTLNYIDPNASATLQAILTFAAMINSLPKSSIVGYLSADNNKPLSITSPDTSSSTSNQVLNIITALQKTTYLNNLSSKLAILQRIPDSTTWQKVLNNPGGINGNLSLLLPTPNPAISATPTSPTTQASTTTNNSSTSTSANAATTNPANQNMNTLLSLLGNTSTATQVASPAPSATNTTSSNNVDLGYCNTIQGFLVEEFVNIMQRSPAFASTGFLYINPIMRQFFGFDLQTLLSNESATKYSVQIQNKDLPQLIAQWSSATAIDSPANLIQNSINFSNIDPYQTITNLTINQAAVNAQAQTLSNLAANYITKTGTALTSAELDQLNKQTMPNNVVTINSSGTGSLFNTKNPTPTTSTTSNTSSNRTTNLLPFIPTVPISAMGLSSNSSDQ